MDLYITTDEIGKQTGGGVVTKNESEAMASQGEIIWLDRRLLHPGRVGMGENAFAYDVIAASHLLSLFDQYQFGLAHFYSGTFPSTVSILKERGVKVAYTVAAHNPKISREEHDRIGLSLPLPHIQVPEIFRYYTECFRKSDVIVCPSKRSASIMRDFGCQKVVVINHGIEHPVVPLEPYPSEFKVGYLGQCGADKGLMYLLMAAKMTGDHLVMAGNAPEFVLDLWRRFGGGKIDIKGFVPSPSDLYHNCSVYCQPSATEAWGIEVLEAMAHGRPVICSEGAGAAEAITDGVDGFVVPIRSPEAIAERLDALRKDPDRLRSMGVAARETARKYGWDIIKGQYVDLWRRLRAGTL